MGKSRKSQSPKELPTEAQYYSEEEEEVIPAPEYHEEDSITSRPAQGITNYFTEKTITRRMEIFTEEHSSFDFRSYFSAYKGSACKTVTKTELLPFLVGVVESVLQEKFNNEIKINLSAASFPIPETFAKMTMGGQATLLRARSATYSEFMHLIFAATWENGEIIDSLNKKHTLKSVDTEVTKNDEQPTPDDIEKAQYKSQCLASFLLCLIINGSKPAKTDKVTKMAQFTYNNIDHSTFDMLEATLGNSAMHCMVSVSQQLITPYLTGSLELGTTVRSRVRAFMAGTSSLRAVLSSRNRMVRMTTEMAPDIMGSTMFGKPTETQSVVLQYKERLLNLMPILQEMASCALYHPQHEMNIPSQYPSTHKVFWSTAHMLAKTLFTQIEYSKSPTFFTGTNPKGGTEATSKTYDGHEVWWLEILTCVTFYLRATEECAFKIGEHVGKTPGLTTVASSKEKETLAKLTMDLPEYQRTTIIRRDD